MSPDAPRMSAGGFLDVAGCQLGKINETFTGLQRRKNDLQAFRAVYIKVLHCLAQVSKWLIRVHLSALYDQARILSSCNISRYWKKPGSSRLKTLYSLHNH